jgi:hypothetical protein
MSVEVDNKGPAVGYLDPECLCSTMLSSTDNTISFSVSVGVLDRQTYQWGS